MTGGLAEEAARRQLQLLAHLVVELGGVARRGEPLHAGHDLSRTGCAGDPSPPSVGSPHRGRAHLSAVVSRGAPMARQSRPRSRPRDELVDELQRPRSHRARARGTTPSDGGFPGGEPGGLLGLGLDGPIVALVRLLSPSDDARVEVHADGSRERRIGRVELATSTAPVRLARGARVLHLAEPRDACGQPGSTPLPRGRAEVTRRALA